MGSAADWTNATPRQMFGYVLRPEQLLERATYDSAEPHPELSGWIERYWSVTWDLDPDEVVRTSTLDEPSVHLTRERGGARRIGTDGPGAWVTGPVTRGRFDVDLTGQGDVIGVKFKIGGFLAVIDPERLELRALRDTTTPAGDWFPDGGPPAELPAGARDAAPALDSWLLGLEPREPPGYAAFHHVLEILGEPSITTLAALEARTGLTARSLQRLLDRFAGVSPKRMLIRARVNDAVSLLDRGDQRPLTDIAHALGWYDQSHFIRDFRAITGQSPSAYRQRARPSGRDIR